LTAPAVRRLDPAEQAQVDQMWANMLSTPDRLDRGLLLDVMLTFELHQLGVDRATYHAEKNVAGGGVVVMDMQFDRLKPLDDWFFVEIFDHDHKSLRKERYAGDEIWAHYNDLLGPSQVEATTRPSTGPTAATQATTRPTDAELRNAWREARLRQIMAATQPAR
jgi:hypothetical protein